jgi:alpha-glucoside transport system substrate-binding protein
MRHSWRITALAGVFLLGTAACGGGSGEEKGGDSTKAGGQALKGVTIEVAAKWTGPEEENFRETLKVFEENTGATVKYASTGENTDAYLGAQLKGGKPPDVAILPQPGLLAQYARKGELEVLSDDVTAAIDENYSPYWKELGSVEGKTYGVLAKAAYKSIIWYRTGAFEEAGVQPPATWNDLVTVSGTLIEAGTTPFTLAAGAQDSWTLTDWFENVYLSQAGAENYDKLAKHEIKWTHPTVTTALQTLAQVWGNGDFIAGGAVEAQSAEFDGSVTDVFGREKAAMVYGGDFAAANIQTTKAEVGQDAQIFPFPKAGESAPAVLGGDIAVAMKDSEGAMELMKFLATPEAGEKWAGLGGYLSPNKNVKPEVYKDPIARQLAQQILSSGDAARYDLSDLTPAAFGGTPGRGMWEGLRTLVKNPADVKGVQARLEADATKAYKG